MRPPGTLTSLRAQDKFAWAQASNTSLALMGGTAYAPGEWPTGQQYGKYGNLHPKHRRLLSECPGILSRAAGRPGPGIRSANRFKHLLHWTCVRRPPALAGCWRPLTSRVIPGNAQSQFGARALSQAQSPEAAVASERLSFEGHCDAVCIASCESC